MSNDGRKWKPLRRAASSMALREMADVIQPFRECQLVAGAAAVVSIFVRRSTYTILAFREWVRLSVPLGLGISILMADSLYQRYFASGSPGDISRLYYARQLFTVPLGILGQTAGQASLPFFARLFGERRSKEFGVYGKQSGNGNLPRFQFCAPRGSWLRRFRSSIWCIAVADSISPTRNKTAVYLLCFSLALGFWAIQVLYARAFFAAGDSLTPMVGSTIVTIMAFPIYAVMFRMFSIVGLVIASDIAIVLDTAVLAVLLHRRHLVRLTDLRWREIGKVMAVASFAGLTAWGASQAIPTAWQPQG